MAWQGLKLNLRVAQKQILTPGLVQMVSVLALNRLELREMINQEMIANPVLEELLVQMGLETVRTSKAYTLSGGERRRLEIARSLTLQPSFILLDEPFSGIDPLTVKDLQEIIRGLSRSGIGILITDHNVRETLNVTDRAYIVNHGKIMAKGTPLELSNDAEVRRVYLGDHFRLN